MVITKCVYALALMVNLREIMDNSHDMSDISMLFLLPRKDLEQAKRLEDQRLRQCHAEQRQEATYDIITDKWISMMVRCWLGITFANILYGIIIIHQLAIPFLTRWVVAVDTKILFCLLGVSKNEVLAGDRQTTKGVERLSWLQQMKYFTTWGISLNFPFILIPLSAIGQMA